MSLFVMVSLDNGSQSLRGLNILSWMACYVLVPDTQGKSLENLTSQRKSRLSIRITENLLSLTNA